MIKIENPKTGDDTRTWGPPFAKPLPVFASPEYPGESAYFLSVLLLEATLTEGESQQEVSSTQLQTS